MKIFDNIRSYTWIEFLFWFVILFICVGVYRFHKYQEFKSLPSYQIFMPDIDGMIVGSPVKYMGVQIGYVNNTKIIGNSVYVKFILTDKNLKLPKGVIATVEFNGLGGSKSLELYPAEDNTDKLIVVEEPIRIRDSLRLFNEMYEKVDSICSNITRFVNNMGVVNNDKIEINPDNVGKTVKEADKYIDELKDNRENFMLKLRGFGIEERENYK